MRHSRHPIAVAASPAVAGHSPLSLAVAVAACFSGLPVLAQPTGAQVIHGSATLVQQGNQMVVTTGNGAGTSHSAINWQSFSIPAGQATQFVQPSAASTSINRVLGNNPSAIFGTLSSNGKLVLVNPAGIAVGTGAVVDTAGFTASTLRMTDADALAGRLAFGEGGLAGGLTVGGQIVARSGDVVLIAPQVETAAGALIQSPGGATVLAAGQKVEVTGRGLEGIRLQVQAPGDSAVNLGTLQGDAVGVFAGTLRHSGLIQATAVTAEGGKVVLRGMQQADIGGSTSARKGALGGEVHATASKVMLRSGAVIDVSGAQGGGEALIGGGWQGKDPRLTNAVETTVERGSTVKANATDNGDGGMVVLWSDGATRFAGRIEAKGGARGGNGGKVETSGKRRLGFDGEVDTSAPMGTAGAVLLDPQDIIIANGSGGAGDAGLGDSLIDGADANASTDITISENALETNSIVASSITLQASRDVIFQDLTDNQLNLTNVVGGKSFVVTAGRDIIQTADVNDRIVTSGGAVSLSTTAGQINIGGIRTQGGAVTLNAGGGNGNLVVREITTTPGGGNGGDISLTSGGFMTLGGANIDARAPGTRGNVTLTSAGAISQQNGTTLWGNDVKMTAVGGITNSASGPMAIDAVRVNASNAGSGNLLLSHTGTGDIAVDDIGTVGYGVRNTAAAGGVTLQATQSKLTVSSSISSAGGDIVLASDKLAIGAVINSGSATTGTVTFKPWNNATGIDLGSTTDVGTKLELSDAELDKVTAGVLRVGGNGYSGGIDLSQHISIANAQVDQLSLENIGDIKHTSAQTIAANKLNVASDGQVDLDSNNSVTVLSGKYGGANGFSFNNNGPLQIGTFSGSSGIQAQAGASGGLTVTTSGLLTVNDSVIAGSTGGNVVLTGGGVTLGTNKLVSAPVGNITVDGTANTNSLSLGSGTLSSAGGGTITVNNAQNVTLGAVNTTGTLLANTNIAGAITQDASNALNVTNLNAVATGTINLSNTANQIVNVTGLSTTNSPITLYEANGFSVNTAVNAGTALVDLRTTNGNLTLNGTGSVASSGATLMAQGASRNLVIQGNITGPSTLSGANNVSISSSSGAITLNGPATITAGTGIVTVLGTNGTTFLNPITSANIIEVSGVLTAGGIITIPKLKLSGSGVLNGSSQISVPTSFDWAGGTVTGTGALVLGGATAITGSVNLSRPVTNNGTITLSGAGAVTMAAGGSIDNTGFFDIQIDNGFSGAGGVFNNNGTFRKTAGTGLSFIDGLTIFTNPSGKTVQVSSGIVAFGTGVFAQNSGILDIAPGSTLSNLNTSLTNNSTGVVQGFGTLDLGTGTFNNNGTLRPGGTGSIGTLSLTAAAYNHGATAKFDTELTSSASYDIIMHNGAGAVTLTSGAAFNMADVAPTYVVGDVFHVMKSASGTIGGSLPSVSGFTVAQVPGTPYVLALTKQAAAPTPAPTPPAPPPPTPAPPTPAPPAPTPPSPAPTPPAPTPPAPTPPAPPPPAPAPSPATAEPSVDRIVELLRNDVSRAEVRRVVEEQDSVVTTFTALLLREEQRQDEDKDKDKNKKTAITLTDVQCTP